MITLQIILTYIWANYSTYIMVNEVHIISSQNNQEVLLSLI